MGLLRSVRGLSWGLSGGLVAVVVGRAISAPGRRGGVSLRRIAVQFKMVFLMAIIARLPGWTHSSALGMFKLTEANEACSPNFCPLLPGCKRLEPAFGQGFAGVSMMCGFFAYNTPDIFSIPCILTLWRYIIRLRGGGISDDGRRDLRSSRRGRGYRTGDFGLLFPTS